jgi:predicted transcriptional regulator
MSKIEVNDAPLEGGVLRVRVGPDVLAEGLAQFAQAARAAQDGTPWAPRFGVSFSELGPMLAVFTPKRWALIAALREGGACTVAALARRLGRDYKNVHGDVAALAQWMAVQRLPDGRVHVPWSEIVVDMQLPAAMAA